MHTSHNEYMNINYGNKYNNNKYTFANSCWIFPEFFARYFIFYLYPVNFYLENAIIYRKDTGYSILRELTAHVL